jgi:hypothetical protein
VAIKSATLPLLTPHSVDDFLSGRELVITRFGVTLTIHQRRG